MSRFVIGFRSVPCSLQPSQGRNERERVNDVVWETLKMTLINPLMSANDSNEDVVFTPPNSPTNLKLAIFKPTPSTLHHHCTPSKSRRLLNLHEKIVKELFDPQFLGYLARQCTPSSE